MRTRDHIFPSPHLVMDLTQLRRVPVEQCNDPLMSLRDDDYEAWLDERWADQWELAE